MIGVVASDSEQGVVREFFELFKTPWEFYRWGHQYDVVLCCGGEQGGTDGKLIVLYDGLDGREGRMLQYRGQQIPVYGPCKVWEGTMGQLTEESSGLLAMRMTYEGSRITARVGYNLLGEVRRLLTAGQPSANAASAVLDLHIALLRNLIVGNGIPLIEIPPVPQGSAFVACLTHDVDHPLVRKHKLDHTMAGFLYRATVGSVRNWLHGRLGFGGVFKNWAAALRLPLVHLGLAKDFWSEFDRFADLEDGAPSTFFVIPFANRAGMKEQGGAPAQRAARYCASDVGEQLGTLLERGCEIGLHGIDAWHNTVAGCMEMDEIRRVTGRQEIGVRMHWLYFQGQSPEVLERAGFAYDSTVGFNETVGFRAGTSQVYQPLEAARLLELPLHIMDTALFYPSYLDLRPVEAKVLVNGILDHAVMNGGCVTVNWHDRSIAPERLWGEFYVDLVAELKRRGAWFATASQAVRWFRKRRTAVFEEIRWEAGEVHVRIAAKEDSELPGLVVRVYNGRMAPATAVSVYGKG